ncbi:MAG TPA: hypothetical protein VF771_03330 [Longimicrobiaceae bacterium]
MFKRGKRMALPMAAAVALLAAAAACDLTEVRTEPGDDVVVVEAVLRTDFQRQQVLLHRAVQGAFAGGVTAAEVVVEGPNGARHRFVQDVGCYRIDPGYAASDSLDFHGTCYANLASDTGWVKPGGTYDLTVTTADGRVIRGRTHLAGDFVVRNLPPPLLGANEPVCSIPPDSTLPLVWTRAAGTASYVSDLRITGLRSAFAGKGLSVPEPLELRGLSVSETDTTIVLPTEFGLFERLTLDTELLTAIAGGFPENVQMELVVSAADINWVNSVRGGNFNPSGLIRISTVAGDGVGVFGSLVVKHAAIVVRRRTAIPRCLLP